MRLIFSKPAVPGLPAVPALPLVPAVAAGLTFSAVLAFTAALPLAASAQTAAAPPPAALRAGALPGFGVAVALDGERLLIGRPGAFTFGLPAPPTAPGAVHVFERSAGGDWAETATVTADTKIGDGFGQSVAVAENVLVVGSPGFNRGRGTAFVYERASATDGWTLAGNVSVRDPNPGDSLGAAVAVAGQTVVVGAPRKGGGGGAAYAYQKDANGAWVQRSELTPQAYESGGRFGAAIAATESTIAIGGPGGFPSLVPGSAPPVLVAGSVQIFESDESGAWVATQRLQPEQAGPSGMGWSVALSGADLLVGAPLGNQFNGAVHHFRQSDGGMWSKAGELTPTEPRPQSGFGMGVALAGEVAAAGAPLAANALGGMIIFQRNAEGVWEEKQWVSAESGISFFGAPLAGAGGLMVAAAPAEAFSGSAHVLVRGADGVWVDEAILDDPTAGSEAIVGTPTECTEGDVHGYACADVDLVSFLPVSALGGGRGAMVNDVWGWTDPDTGREYAVVGRNDATAFVDVTDAANPRYLGHLPLTEGALPNMWRDIKVYSNHAFVVADGAGAHGVQIFDLTQLRDVGGEPVTFEETAHYDGIFSAHNIVINEDSGIAYAVGASMGGETCGGGLHMIDVRQPANPTFLGCFSDAATGLAGTGYSHDAQCIKYAGPDAEYADHEICFGANENAISISDVTDKANPVAVARAQYPNSAYLHQGWISDDHRYFYMNDEGDEVAGLVNRTRTLIWDIEDLDDPILLGEHLGTTAASDHNLYVQGRFMYQSNYVSGLRILDVSNPLEVREVGFFDTLGGEDAPGFAGSWSNYPFFDSGVILVTSINEGLFVLKKRQRPVS